MERGYGQYCPIAMAAEVLAERWTPLIIRNLLLGCHRFGEIHEGCPRGCRPRCCPNVCGPWERDGVITSVAAPSGRGRRYHLTPPGQELAEVVMALGAWGRGGWRSTPREQDPFIALWSWARMVAVDALPRHRVVVRFDFRDRPREPFWLLLHRPRPEVCLTHPGIDEDLVVGTDVATLVDVQRSRVRLTDAIAQARFVLSGNPVLVRALPGWGGITPPLAAPAARP